MSEINRAVKGTADVLPQDSFKWQFVERQMLETARLYGFNEIRVPVFEHTEVFLRSVGDTTDVVQKEMYTFEDKGGRSVTLRPEFTAGVIRCAIEKGLTNGALPVKACYAGGCYRYEKPQAGRLREFHQFGVECIGAAAPNADAEVIALAAAVLRSVGIEKISLEINSIGCPNCRKNYAAALKSYFSEHSDALCDTCRDRLERNPMRILDCKSPVCSEIASGAPLVTDYLCDGCREHFEGVQRHLSAQGIEYTVNPHIVRGLDYYTRTVFEFVSGEIGAQSTVCGGGRYDGLIEQMGGRPTPSLGFAMGIERIMLLLEAQKTELPKDTCCDIYIAALGSAAELKATELCAKLRADGFKAQTDICGRGLKAQLKFADKCGARFTVVLGDNEILSGGARLKNMSTGEETDIRLDNLSGALFKAVNAAALSELTDSVLQKGEV